MPVKRSPRNRIALATLTIILILLPMFTQPSSFGTIGDTVEVSPGKIPTSERDHFLANSTVQVKLEYPRSFILQETVGDLVFNVTLKNSTRRINIYIPPEFKVNSDTSYVWTNITNSYSNIRVGKLGTFDDMAPGWYDIAISGMIPSGDHTIRMFDVTAPSIVGQYFFKVLTDGKSIGAGNFPSVIVSADPNPSYISGVLRYGGRLNATAYGKSIWLNETAGEGAKVQATGITDQGSIVIGRAYLNSTNGNYTLYGLTAGRYHLNATAATYAPAELPYEIILKAGQSLEGADIFLEHSSVITVVALSRWMKQPVPWGLTINATDPDHPLLIKKTITLEVLDIWNQTVRLLNDTTDPYATFHTLGYRGERDLDGHIPQEGSGFVGGIEPGRYYIRVWVNGYVQPSAANKWAWTNDCAVVFSDDEQDKMIDIILEKTGVLRVTVHFMNSAETLSEAPTESEGTLIVEAYDLDEEQRASARTRVEKNSTMASVELTGPFNSSRDYGLPAGEYIVFARFTSRFSPGMTDLGLPWYVSVGGTYLPSAYRYGATGHRVSIGEGRNEISFYVLLQGGLNLTVYPITSQKPFTVTTWGNHSSTIRAEVRDRYGVEAYGSLRLMPEWNRKSVNASGIGLDDGVYSLYVFTYGYVQKQIVFFNVRRGAMADVSVQMIKGAEIEVTVIFQKQQIIDRIDTYKKYGDVVPVRFEVYNSKNEFVGANITYVNANLTYGSTPTRALFNVTLRGFRSYRGNTATRWVNYYDTTDGTSQRDSGLGQDLYTIKVYVPGYEQLSDPIIDARPRASMTVSVVISLRRMGHISGKVYTYNDRFWNYTRMSWARVDALGQEMDVSTSAPDGFYEMWLSPGTYLVIVSLPGYQTQSLRIQIPDGSDVQYDFQLLPLEMTAQGRFFSLTGVFSVLLMTVADSD